MGHFVSVEGTGITLQSLASVRKYVAYQWGKKRRRVHCLVARCPHTETHKECRGPWDGGQPRRRHRFRSFWEAQLVLGLIRQGIVLRKESAVPCCPEHTACWLHSQDWLACSVGRAQTAP